MQFKRHIADFVQKQRAAIGLFKTSAPHGLRSGERAALVPKEFAFEQIFRDCCGIDSNEWPIGAGRMLMQCAGNQFFTRTAFARNHDGNKALAQTTDGAKHILHRRRLPQHFGRFFDAVFNHFFALAFFHRAANEFHRFGQIKRLWKVFKRTALKRTHRAIQIRIRGHDDDGQPRIAVFDLFQQIQARPARHPNIADQHLRAILIRRGLQSG